MIRQQLAAAISRGPEAELRVSIQALLALGANDLIDPYWLKQYHARGNSTGAVTVQKSALKKYLFKQKPKAKAKVAVDDFSR